MTEKTTNLISELTKALFEKKAILITGNTGVGKTYIAKEIIRNMQNGEFSLFPDSLDQGVVHEIIPCHSGVAYEDLVGGISTQTHDGNIHFNYTNKILIDTLNKASDAYHKKLGTRYVLLLDDIQRCDVSSLFGDAVASLGTESKETKIHLNSGATISVTPNFYVIGTYNQLEENALPIPIELLGRFYVRELLSDINYITENENSDNAVFYNRVRSLVLNHLDIQFKTSSYEQNLQLIGHGYFSGNDIRLRIKHQVLPILKQYVSEGILDSKSEPQIELLESDCIVDRSTKDICSDSNCFEDYQRGVTSKDFVAEGGRDKASLPIEYLVGRIIEQELLSNTAIKNGVLFNDYVMFRECEHKGSIVHATLVASDSIYKCFSRKSSNDARHYNGGTIKIDGEEHHFTGGAQPGDFVKSKAWEITGYLKLGETFGANLVLYRIVWQYYQTLINEFTYYERNNPHDKDKSKLLCYIKAEWKEFYKRYKSIEPTSFDKVNLTKKQKQDLDTKYNEEANFKVRELIGQLQILWKNPGDLINLSDGTTIILEGVENKMTNNVYMEYKETMDSLGIRQMILQGPPGTSKTYSAKGFLKYLAHECTENELSDMQIDDYVHKDKFCALKRRDKACRPPIAWDIVQFHPSYGYEDFIRGISVSTKNGTDSIVYDTVNKVLGNIAELASSNPNTEFYLIIDEINRANLATVFGELIYGLEYRNDAVATPYAVKDNNRICIPDNLYIIGTMNTADKSIGGIDYAIRRRFLFFEQLPDRSVIENYNLEAGEAQSGLNKKAGNLFDYVKKVFDENLNPEYRLEDVQIGHTYFLVDSEEKLLRRFEYQIIPILKEYYKDGILSINTEYEENGFAGFLNCISGRISATTQKDVIRNIFEKLIA